MIGYLANKKFSVNKISKDNNSRVLIIEAEIETEKFILLDLYNSNSGTEQLQILSDVYLFSSDFSLDDKKAIVFAVDFNLCFNRKLERMGGNPVLKKKSIHLHVLLLGKITFLDLYKDDWTTFLFPIQSKNLYKI